MNIFFFYIFRSFRAGVGRANFSHKGHIGKYFEVKGRTDWKSKKIAHHFCRCPNLRYKLSGKQKKVHHFRRCPIFHYKSSGKQKKNKR